MTGLKYLKLLSFILLATLYFKPVQASVPCSSLWLRGFPELGHMSDAGTCHRFIPESTILHSGQEMYFQNNSGENPTAKQQMEWAADALVYASAKYSAFASVPKLKMIYSASPYGPDSTSGNLTRAFSYVEFFTLGIEACPIVIYPASADLSKDHFYQLIAHEIYHCVQKVEFPNQTSAAVQGQSEGLFWYESMAQFMSNDVYPSFDFEYHTMFGRFDGHLAFFDQSSPYLSEGFFQGLFWFMGANTANVHRIQNHFGGPGASALQEALAIPRISEALHETARKISFNELQDSSGAQALWRVERQVITVSDAPASSITIPFMDFAIEPFEIIFPKRGRYRLNIHRVDGAKLSVRKAGASTWQDHFDTEFVTECDQDRKLEGIFTRVSSDYAMNSIRIDITRLDNEDCPCEIEQKPTDVCLFGSWAVEPEGVMDFMNRLSGGAFQAQSVAGTLKLTFAADGTHSWDYQNLSVTGLIADRRHVRTVTWWWNGVQNLNYSNLNSVRDKLVCSKAVSGSVEGRATMTVEGRTVSIPGGPYAISGQGLMPYECNRSTFKYSIMAGPLPLNWTFRRLTTPPPGLR